MKLEYLFNLPAPVYPDTPQMTVQELLTELNTAPPIPPSAPDFGPAYSKQLGTMDNLPVWASRCFGSDLFAIGFLLPDNTCPAFVVIRGALTKNAHSLIRIETTPAAKPGMITALLMFIVRKEKWKIIITQDEPLTQHGWNFLIRSVERGIINIIDTATHTPITAHQLKSARSAKITDLEVFVEGIRLKYEHVVWTCPGMLSEVVCFVGDVHL